MDFKRKLGFLPTPSTPPVNVPLPAPSAAVELNVIDQLRAKMAEILDRPVVAAPPRKPADPTETLLPFVREETPAGPIYRRHTILPSSHHVGRMPVDSAYASRSELLALLALDPALAGCSIGRALSADSADLTQARDEARRLLEQTAKTEDPARRLDAVRDLSGTKGTSASDRDQMEACLRALASLLRDLGIVATQGDRRTLANADLEAQLEKLTGSFDHRRSLKAYAAVDEALNALERNASTKVVADWLVLQL